MVAVVGAPLRILEEHRAMQIVLGDSLYRQVINAPSHDQIFRETTLENCWVAKLSTYDPGLDPERPAKGLLAPTSAVTTGALKGCFIARCQRVGQQ